MKRIDALAKGLLILSKYDGAFVESTQYIIFICTNVPVADEDAKELDDMGFYVDTLATNTWGFDT